MQKGPFRELRRKCSFNTARVYCSITLADADFANSLVHVFVCSVYNCIAVAYAGFFNGGGFEK